MFQGRLAKRLVASVLSCCAVYGVAHGADPLPAESRVVAAPNAPAPTQLSFMIATTQDLQVTLTDLRIPAPLASANIAVTQGNMIVGSATMAAPATSATFSITGALGSYTLSVFGAPGASFSVGTFTACVAPKANPSACIQNASLSGNITAESSAKDPTVSTLSTSLSVTTAGSYTFTFADLKFPVALNVAPSVALFQGNQPAGPQPIPSGTSINLSPGTYTLLGIAQADQTAKAGLWGITISGAAGTTPLLDTAVPVGLTSSSSPFDNPSAQSVTLKVTDFGFPGALAGASALLTSGGTAVGQASAAGGAMTFAAPAGALVLWTNATVGATPGTYEADVMAGAANLFTSAQGVSPTGSAYAYAFVTPKPVSAGTYQATAADLQFPSQLTALSFAVAQNGMILQQSPVPTAIHITATAGPVVFLVSAQAPAAGGVSGNGLFDVNVQTTGASAQLVYDQTQSVSSTPSLFDSQTITLGIASNFDATLTDLKFPAAFDSLALVVSRGTEILGKIYGGGRFSFPGSVGSYQLTFVASPAAMQQFGMYGVSVVFSPPAITSFTASASTAGTNSPITLTWATSNAISCTGSGGGWTVTAPGTSGSQSVVLSSTTTYTLSCTGAGGMSSKSVTVTAVTPASTGGGGGAIDLGFLAGSSALLLVRLMRRKKIRVADRATADMRQPVHAPPNCICVFREAVLCERRITTGD